MHNDRCLTPHEAEIKGILEAGRNGRKVEVIHTVVGKTPDFRVDGVPKEIKEVKSFGKNMVKKNIQDALKQLATVGGGNVIIDTGLFSGIDATYLIQQVARIEGINELTLRAVIAI